MSQYAHLLSGIDPETMRRAVAAYRETAVEPLRRDITATAGLNTAAGLYAKSLEAPSHLLFPSWTPIRNMIPREKQEVVTLTENWEQVIANNTAGVWVSVAENAAGSQNARSVRTRTGTIKYLGLRDYVGDDAALLGRSFEDLRALGVLSTMMALMQGEEDLDIGGNTATLVAPTPAGTTATSGGALPDSTAHDFKVSCLTLKGYREAIRLGGSYAPAAGGGQSAAGTASGAITTGGSGGAHTITISWADVPGAVAYNIWVQQASGNYVYAHTTPGSATVTVNTWTMTAASAATAHAGSIVASSANASDYSGLLEHIVTTAAASEGGIVKSLNNASLTSEASGVVELNDEFDNVYRADGCGPEFLLCGTNMARRLQNLALTTASSGPAISINVNGGDQGYVGGLIADSLLNGSGAEPAKVRILGHAKMPPNMIIGFRMSPPFAGSRVDASFKKRVASEFEEIPFARADGATGNLVDAWAVRVRQYLQAKSCLGCVVWKNVKES